MTLSDEFERVVTDMERLATAISNASKSLSLAVICDLGYSAGSFSSTVALTFCSPAASVSICFCCWAETKLMVHAAPNEQSRIQLMKSIGRNNGREWCSQR